MYFVSNNLKLLQNKNYLVKLGQIKCKFTEKFFF